MNNRYDDNYSRRERDWDRERDRHREGRESEWGRREGSRSSFYPGSHGSDEQSSPYGQREPYSTGGPGGGTYGASGQGDYSRDRDERRGYSPEDYSREWREGRGERGSRYGESQYGQGRQGQGEYDPRRNWGGRSTPYRSSQGWDDWDRGSPYGDRGPRYGSSRAGDDDYGHTRRYGVGYTGSSDFERDRSFGDDRFTRADEPRYLGTGYYAEGTSAFGGGFGEERWRSHPSGRHFFGGHEDERRERPGLFRRLFGKGPKGYQRSDERLREDISERLMEAGDIDSSEVTVQVSSGKVTLEGTVPDRYMKHAIEDMVDACPGVQDIDNRVRVDRSAYGSSGYTGVSSASSTTPGSTSSTGTSYGSTGTSGMSSGSSYGAGSSTGTTSGTGQTGTNRSTRKDS